MDTRKRLPYFTKEKLPELNLPEGYEPSEEALTRCAEKMRHALRNPNLLPQHFIFIEIEE